MPRKPHFFTTANPLLTGEDEGSESGYGAFRPKGSMDWLSLYTVAGRGFFVHGNDLTELTAGDLLLVRPGVAQDYGADPQTQHWHNVWTHFVPRGDALASFDWPSIAPGVMRLHVPEAARGEVLAALREADRIHRHGRRLDLGLNALERALLLADEAHPRGGSGRDPRVRKAVDFLLDRLTNPPTHQQLADVAGLSRSRFAKLFEEQVGETPGRFIEEHRLLEARRLLEHTSQHLADIAAALGFSSAFYLSLRFKKYFGLSPRDYRLKHVARKSDQ